MERCTLRQSLEQISVHVHYLSHFLAFQHLFLQRTCPAEGRGQSPQGFAIKRSVEDIDVTVRFFQKSTNWPGVNYSAKPSRLWPFLWSMHRLSPGLCPVPLCSLKFQSG